MVGTSAWSEGGGPKRYEAATIAFENHRYGEAAAGFQAVVGEGGPLMVYARVRWADALAAGGDAKGAEARYREVIDVTLPGPWKRMAAARLAALLEGQRRYAEARELYDVAMDVPFKPWWYDDLVAASATNATHFEERAAEGYAHFTEIYRTSIYPAKRKPAARALAESPFTDDRLLAIVGLGREGEEEAAAALMRTMMATNDGVLRGHLAFINGALHLLDEDEASKAFDATDPPDALWARWCLISRMSHEGARENWDACQRIADTMVRVWPGSHETAEAIWRHAYWLRERDQPVAAAQVFLRVARATPLHRRADDAYVAAAEQFEKAHMTSEAVGAYEALTEAHPTTRLASEAHWKLVELLADDTNKSGMVAAIERGADGSIGHYYTHRMIARADAGETRAPLPNSISGLIGYRPQALDAPTPLPAEVTSDPRYARLDFFGAHGFEEGEWEALDLMSGPLDDLWRPLRYRVLADTGYVHTATEFCVFEGYGQENGHPTAERLRIFYGRPHWDHVLALSRETGVDPYLILAVGRQESTFRPALESYAGANGLMQIMPSTAKWMADADPGISRDDVSRLENPRKSLRLGAFYLKRMLARWDGGIVHALASYNAGPGNAIKWDKRFDSNDLGDWVEQIPFSETQDYVKRVLGNYAAYRTLYGAEPPSAR